MKLDIVLTNTMMTLIIIAGSVAIWNHIMSLRFLTYMTVFFVVLYRWLTND